MSGNPEHAQRARGKKLAVLLASFIQSEASDPEDEAQMMIGVYEHFEQHTAALRRPGNPWPRESGEPQQLPDDLSQN